MANWAKDMKAIVGAEFGPACDFGEVKDMAEVQANGLATAVAHTLRQIAPGLRVVDCGWCLDEFDTDCERGDHTCSGEITISVQADMSGGLPGDWGEDRVDCDTTRTFECGEISLRGAVADCDGDMGVADCESGDWVIHEFTHPEILRVATALAGSAVDWLTMAKEGRVADMASVGCTADTRVNECGGEIAPRESAW